LAQGTSWADAETQAFYYMPVGGLIPLAWY
jgi:hypothetical protein